MQCMHNYIYRTNILNYCMECLPIYIRLEKIVLLIQSNTIQPYSYYAHIYKYVYLYIFIEVYTIYNTTTCFIPRKFFTSNCTGKFFKNLTNRELEWEGKREKKIQNTGRKMKRNAETQTKPYKLIK